MSAIEEARAARRRLQLGYPKLAHRPAVVQEAMDAFDALIADHEALLREMHQRELHHFETEKALTEVLAYIEADPFVDISNEMTPGGIIHRVLKGALA